MTINSKLLMRSKNIQIDWWLIYTEQNPNLKVWQTAWIVWIQFVLLNRKPSFNAHRSLII